MLLCLFEKDFKDCKKISQKDCLIQEDKRERDEPKEQAVVNFEGLSFSCA